MTNKELAKKAVTELMFNRDLTALDRYWSDQYTQHNPTRGNGREAVRQLFASVPPNFKYDLGLIVADGDFVMVHGRYSGLGPRPLVGVDIFKVKDGKFVEHWDVLQEEVPTANTESKNPMFTVNL